MHQPITTAVPDARAGRTHTHTAALLTQPAPILRPFDASAGHEYAAADTVRSFERNRRVITAHSTLRMLFLRALQHSDERSTPLIPTTFALNVADEGERDRFEPRLRMEPVTAVAAGLSDRQHFFERVLAAMRTGFAVATDRQRAEAIEAMNAELADAYADAYAADLVAIGWSEQS